MPLLDNCIPTPGLAPSNVLNQLGGGGLTMPDLEWINLRRPFVNSNGKACVTINSLKPNDYVVEKGVKRRAMRTYLVNDLRNRGYNLPLVTNATALPMNAWIEMDRVMLKEVRQRLLVTADLEARSSYGGFDAFNRSTVEYNAMSDFGEAIIDMDAAVDGRVDGPLFLPRSTPLPITHSDFGYTSRQLGISRNGGIPFDTASIEQGTRRVAESIEDQVLGNITGMTFGTRTGYHPHDGTSTVYGYRNFADRLTKTNFTAPTAGGWVANTTYNEILTALQQLADQYYDGPFMLYYSTDWDSYMNQVFSISGGNNNNETLLTMLKKHPKILDVKYVPRLTSTFTFLFVQMTSDVVRLINGMDFTTIQWEEKGGLELRIKVLAIKVPQLRSTYAGRTGILHGTTS